MKFSGHVPLLDCSIILPEITSFIRSYVTSSKRGGVVIGLSGGIDSALCARLCVESLGKDKVLGLILPERESDPKSSTFARNEISKLGIRTEIVDITEALDSLGSYQLRDNAINEIIPTYNGTQKTKMVLPGNLLSKDSLNFYTLIIQENNGTTNTIRLNNITLRKIIAANNLKQRTRMLYLYRYAEKQNYMVCGTTNRTEFIQGFFVRYGDGGVDLEPIADLYKTQVYQLARYLGVSQEIIDRIPTPDTFSLGVTDEEFYFRIPYDKLDIFLYAWENKFPVIEVAEILNLSIDQVNRVFRDLNSKYTATKHLRVLPPSPGLKVNDGK